MGVVETLGIGITVAATGAYGLTTLARGVSSFESQLTRAYAASTQLGFSLKRIGSGTSNFAMRIVNTGENYVQMAANIEQANFLIAKTTELPQKQMDEIDKDLTNMVNKTSVAKEELQKMSERAGSAGYGSGAEKFGETLEALSKRFPILKGLAESAFEASKREIEGATRAAADMRITMGEAMSPDQLNVFYKAAFIVKDPLKDATTQLREFQDSIIGVGNNTPAVESDLTNVIAKFGALSSITGRNKDDMIALAGVTIEAGEQSRTVANNLVGLWTGLIKNADNAVVVFDKLGFKSGEDLRAALKNPETAVETLLKFSKVYAEKLQEGSVDAQNFMIDVNESMKGIFGSKISDRIFINLAKMTDRFHQFKQISIDSFGKSAKESEKFQKTTLAGLTRMNESIKRVKESLGKQFAPILFNFYTQVLKMVDALRKWVHQHETLEKFLKSHAAHILVMAFAFGKIANVAGDIVLVATGLSRALPLFANPGILAGAAAIAAIAGAAYLVYGNFGDFSKDVKKFWGDIKDDVKIFTDSLGELFTTLGNKIKDAFSSEDLKKWAEVLLSATKGGIKIAIQAAGAGVEAVNNMITGKDNHKALDNLKISGINAVPSVVNAGIDVIQSGWIDDISKTFNLLTDPTFQDMVWQTFYAAMEDLGSIIYNGLSFALDAMFKYVIGPVGLLLYKGLWFILKSVLIDTIILGGLNLVWGMVKAFVTQQIAEDWPDIVAAFDTIKNFFVKDIPDTFYNGFIKPWVDLWAKISEWISGLLDWFNSNAPSGFDPKSGLDEQGNMNPLKGTGLEGFASGVGGQTGRIIRKPTRLRGFGLGEAGPEAIVPLDRSSKTRGMRSDMSKKSGNQVHIVKTEFKFHEKVLGEIIQHIQTGDIEANYGYVGMTGSGVG